MATTHVFYNICMTACFVQWIKHKKIRQFCGFADVHNLNLLLFP